MSERRIRRLLVAARGAEALSIARSVRAAGVEVVALFAARDAEAGWVERVDFAVYVPDEGGRWPSPRRVVDAAQDAGCDAIHPGWGPLARDPRLAEAIVASNLGFVGAPYDRLRDVADRIAVRRLAERAGIPVVPGTEAIAEVGDAEGWVAMTGLPVVVKFTHAAGQGRSVRLDEPGLVGKVVRGAMMRGPVYLERYVRGARLIEVPVFGDGEGDAKAVGNREVTVRLDGVRVVAECPAPSVGPELAELLAATSEEIAAQLAWEGLGVVQYLLTPDGRPYMLQLRPGLQPWHAVTERVYGVDLVDAQLRLAEGEALGWERVVIAPEGHAIGLRVVARSPGGGLCGAVALSVADGVGVETAVSEGDPVDDGDDLALLTVGGRARQPALVRAKAALDDVDFGGLAHNGEHLRRLFDSPEFWRGPVDRDWLEDWELRSGGH